MYRIRIALAFAVIGVAGAAGQAPHIIMATPDAGAAIPLQAGEGSWALGKGTHDATLAIVDSKDSVIKLPLNPAGNSTSNGPVPKLRPRLGLGMNSANPAAPLPQHLSDSPTTNIIVDFLHALLKRTAAEWDHVLITEHLPWDSEIEVHCFLQVDEEKGTITVDHPSSPSNPALAASFNKMLAALAPLNVPIVLQALVGKELRLKLDFKNGKSTEPPGPPKS